MDPTTLEDEAQRRCREGVTGHVFKSLTGEIGGGVKCACGHSVNVRRCIRCGGFDVNDPGSKIAHERI